ncbi:Retrovirus-related Pol polyprotein from transposon RE2 [Glycine soja]|uniref:Retrovirus-related Pol polyprotein from transposon RE2 n=1 Tax=Glycine soja TaxID=3848 RepID=A0A445IZG0_GLYSO|nr:Retrovirus-related Pol polyprotein from transposon RE2 [Glycine soja]
MVTCCKLTKHGTEILTDPSMYRSVVGALQYATITRPEISFSVNQVCQFMSPPLEAHWVAVKRILKYLKGTISWRLHLSLRGSIRVKNLESAILMLAWTGMLGKSYCLEVLVFNAIVVGACMAISYSSLMFSRGFCNM